MRTRTIFSKILLGSLMMTFFALSSILPAAVSSEVAQSLDGSYIIECQEAGVPWGGYSRDFDCRPITEALNSQWKRYTAAKEVALKSSKIEDWEDVIFLSLYTYVKGHHANRIGRILKNEAITFGDLKSKKHGKVRGIVNIYRTKIYMAVAWYNRAVELGVKAQSVRTESDKRDAQSKREGAQIVEQAKKNLVWLQSLLDNENYDQVTGDHRYLIK